MKKIKLHRSTAADIILSVMFTLITVLYALLMFTDSVPLPGLILLGILWFAFWIASRRISFATPMDLPIIGLMILVLTSLFVTINWDLTLPKVYGLVLSAALFYVIVNVFRRQRRLQIAAIAIILLAVATAILGLLGTDWVDSKFTFLTKIYQFLPNLVKAIPDSPAGAGINANTLGGALSFFLPFLVSLFWDKGGFKRMSRKDPNHANLKNILYKAAIWFAMLLVLIALVLTQSRGAYIGSAVGLMILAIWKDNRFLWLLPVFGLIFIVAWQGYAKGSFVELVALLETSGEATLQTRLDLWQNAIYLIQDFPITGTGLSAFGSVFHTFYNFNIFPYGDPVLFHAHNTFLTVAVELGLPALVLYCAILGSFFTMALHTYRTGRAFIRALTIGLSCGMIAHQVFGLMDAYTLGKKLGVIMWIYFGLMTALFIHRHRLNKISQLKRLVLQIRKKPEGQQVKQHLKNMLIGLLYWLLVSSASLTFININPYVSLVTAALGGILLGVNLTQLYRGSTAMGKAKSLKLKVESS